MFYPHIGHLFLSSLIQLLIQCIWKQCPHYSFLTATLLSNRSISLKQILHNAYEVYFDFYFLIFSSSDSLYNSSNVGSGKSYNYLKLLVYVNIVT